MQAGHRKDAQITADGNHRSRRLVLSELIGRNDHTGRTRDHAQGAHQQLAEQDNEHGPHGYGTKVQEQQQGREHEQLIGDGIQELAKVGDLVARTSQVAINLISARQDDVQNKGGGSERAVEGAPIRTGNARVRQRRHDHEHRDKDDAHARHDVGGRPNTRQFLIALVSHDALLLHNMTDKLVAETIGKLDRQNIAH